MGWDAETAEWYAARYGEYPTNRLAADALDLAPDAVVVDVGCGTGSALRRLVGRVPDGRLVGIDPVPRMIELARERLVGHDGADRIELCVGCAESLPVEDAAADVVLAFDSIDHWEDVVGGLLEVRRVLRPGGRLVVVKDGGLPGGADSTRRLETALRDAGLEVQDARALGEDDVRCTMWVCGAP